MAKMEHKVVSKQEWRDARKAFLGKEKEFTRMRDELTEERRNLPWVKVEKEYYFDGPNGRESLADLFEGRSQLIIYHFMFGPGWGAGCPHCSHWADNFNGVIVHLNHRDVTFIAVSHAPYNELASYKKRMGWSFKWMSSHESDFNYDYNVSFTPEEMKQKAYNYNTQQPPASEMQGVSVFYKDESSQIFHTYSTYGRGIDMMNVDYQYLDLTPKGRDENGRGPFWVRRHDEYND
jgi:predicted dithiol-disulfide oxidoreductase (DUF899 family)